MNGLAGKLFFTCQKAGLAVEEKLQKEISFADSIRLKIHLAICDVCKKYARQSEWLEELIRNKFIEKREQELSEEEIDKLKTDILEKLNG